MRRFASNKDRVQPKQPAAGRAKPAAVPAVALDPLEQGDDVDDDEFASDDVEDIFNYDDSKMSDEYEYKEPPTASQELLEYNQVLEKWLGMNTQDHLPVLELLQHMNTQGVRPTRSSFELALRICAKHADPVMAREVLKLMDTFELPRIGIDYMCAITAHADRVDRVRRGEDTTTVPSGNPSAIDAWTRETIDNAFSVYDELRMRGFVPNVTTCIKLLSLASLAIDVEERQAKVRAL